MSRLPLTQAPNPASETQPEAVPQSDRRQRPVWLSAAIIVGVFAVAWGIGGYFLSRTVVPGDLELPDLNPRDEFSQRELDAATRYERFGYVNALLATVTFIAVLAVYAAKGAAFTRESQAGRIGTGMLLAMLGFAVVWISQLPFALAQLWWDRRHDVSEENYLTLLADSWLVLGFEFLFVCFAILIVMGLAGWLRDWWWIVGGPIFVGLAILFSFTLPYAIPGVSDLDDPELVADARELAEAQGTEGIPIKVQAVEEFTTEPNAAAAGIGASRRVILWDTLLDGRFSDEEVRVVIAHEFAHHARDHIWKSIGWYALFAIPGAFFIAVFTKRRGGMYEAAAVPLALLVFFVLQLIAGPIQNVVSRNFEGEADWVALEATEDPQAAQELFVNFAETTESHPSPPTWAYILFGTHPTLMQRLAMVEAWEARQEP